MQTDQQNISALQITEPVFFGFPHAVLINILTFPIGLVIGAFIILSPIAVLEGLGVNNQMIRMIGCSNQTILVAGCIGMVITLLELFFLPLLAGANPYIVHIARKNP